MRYGEWQFKSNDQDKMFQHLPECVTMCEVACRSYWGRFRSFARIQRVVESS
jgi:hypothetical protein